MSGLGLNLVRALEEDWRSTLDEVARACGFATSRDVAKLAARVAELSAAYNDPSRARATMREAGAARLGFAFPRDVPKGAAAVRELVASGVVGRGTPLRVLDVGAGLGAMTWGLLRALEAAQAGPLVLDATWADTDAAALEVGAALARARARRGRAAVGLTVRTVSRSVDALADLGAFEVVILGNVLSELDVLASEAARLDRHVGLVRGWLERQVATNGALVIVEPALRDRTRHLHRIRDALAESGVAVFAPCLHAAPCPALALESDWCHEDLAVDLPAWLVPVARAAGLRHQGLTFSYLVLRKDGRRLVDSIVAPSSAGRLRVVSDAMRSKGKREAFLCGEFVQEGAPIAGRARVMRLDRDATAENDAFSRSSRGSVVVIAPAPNLERPRVGSANSVREASLDVVLSHDIESR